MEDGTGQTIGAWSLERRPRWGSNSRRVLLTKFVGNFTRVCRSVGWATSASAERAKWSRATARGGWVQEDEAHESQRTRMDGDGWSAEGVVMDVEQRVENF